MKTHMDYIGLRVDCRVKPEYTKVIFDLFDHNDWRRLYHKYPDLTFLEKWSEDPDAKIIPFNEVKNIDDWKHATSWHHQISMISRIWRFQCEILADVVGEPYRKFVELIVANFVDDIAVCEVKRNLTYPYYYRFENGVLIVESD